MILRVAQQNVSGRSAYFWLWLIPLTYLIHIAEEYWGGEGYSAFLLRTRGVYLSPTRFLIAQAIGIVLIVLGVLAARWFRSPHIMIVIMASVVLVNALTHIVHAAGHQLSYEPGLLSSVFIWLPLGIFILLRFKRFVKREWTFWLGIVIGVAINVAITVFAMRGGHL